MGPAQVAILAFAGAQPSWQDQRTGLAGQSGSFLKFLARDSGASPEPAHPLLETYEEQQQELFRMLAENLKTSKWVQLGIA